MNTSKKIYIYHVFSLLFIGLLMSSCVYDNIVPEESNNPVTQEGYSLALTIDLPVMDTRSGDSDWEKYEDYVKDFSLLFFKVPDGKDMDPESQTLIRKYDSKNLSFFEVDKGSYGYMKQWYVRIPIDPTKKDDANFVETIRENDFKIAVLANWPGSSVTMEEEDFINKKEGDNINTLHHLVADDIYGNKNGVYYFLTDNGKMGTPTEWVTEAFGSKDDATTWIKENCKSSSQPDDIASEPSELDNDKAHLSFELKDPWLLWDYVTDKSKELPVVTQVTEPITEETEGVFSFMAYASGTLSITARADAADADGATITAQVGNAGTILSYEFESMATTTIEHVISITGDEQRVYIYNSSGNNIEISKIEYIQDAYLYEMARTGKTLEEQYIPMYGVQEFGKLKEVWKEGTVFDLSNFNKLNPTNPKYKGGTIQLLRSVAKVELLLPAEEDFKNVFLRNMNRTAFCEPMDVASSTSEIWVDTESSSYNHDDCEWSKLIGLEPFYTGSKETGHGWANYQNKLSWYYGSWGKYAGNNSPDTGNNKFGGKYPQILNPHINRSDFVEFLEAGVKKAEGTDYNRYILYVPEKFVDDPDFTTGEGWESKAAPKLCHIEFRAQDDPYYNLDDNNCYRIYFTEGGVSGNVPTLEDEGHLWENTYENDPEILKNHWTIMRNHIYTFTVSYKPGGNLAVQVKVLPWKRREVEVNW